MAYARAVKSGKIAACGWVRKACGRQLADLRKHRGKGSVYYWDEKAAEAVCEFAELLPHVKGKWDTWNLVLQPWQKFILCVVFGWKRRGKGKPKEWIRRFKTVYVEVPRKNGKSMLASVIALYMLLSDDEPGAEVYSAATKRDQAKIVFGTALQMVRKSRKMRDHFGISYTQFNINVEKTGSKFEPLASEADSLDGLNTHCAIIDELHAHRTRELYDVMETSTASRRQSALIVITTAGTNRAGICYEQRTYTTKILDKVFQDDTYFGIIYTIDEEDDWQLEKTWEKANPNYGVSIFKGEIARLCKKAAHLASAQPNFLVKHLCVWVNADMRWMDILAWQRAGDDKLDETQFEGEPCWEGIDLASRDDVACRVKLFRRLIEGDNHYYVFCDHYLPEAAIERSPNSQYQGWVADGWITATPGDVTDFSYIEEDLRADKDWYELREVGFDPFQATQFSTRMMAEGFPMVEVTANTKNFSEPMKELEALCLGGRLHHNGDPVLEWMVSNVVAHVDAKDNIFPRKETRDNKIDGVVAMIMALARAMFTTKKMSAYADPETAVM